PEVNQQLLLPAQTTFPAVRPKTPELTVCLQPREKILNHRRHPVVTTETCIQCSGVTHTTSCLFGGQPAGLLHHPRAGYFVSRMVSRLSGGGRRCRRRRRGGAKRAIRLAPAATFPIERGGAWPSLRGLEKTQKRTPP